MAVPVHTHPVPDAQVRRDGRQRLQEWLLQCKQRQGWLARGAVDALAGRLHHPRLGLGVEVGEVTELAQRQEVALDVLDAGFDDALLLRVVRRARVDLEAVAFGALGIRPLHDRVLGTSPGDGALGVVYDDALGHTGEPLEGTSVAAQPGGHRLAPNEHQVLVAAVRLGHHKGPSASGLGIGV